MSFNETFFTRLKESINSIPIKSKFIKDMNLFNNHTGLRYFIQGKRKKPSETSINAICETLGYEYVVIPVKKDSDEYKIYIEKMQNDFFKSLNDFNKKYAKDKSRTYTKKYGEESTVANALDSFNDIDELSEDFKIDIDDIFK